MPEKSIIAPKENVVDNAAAVVQGRAWKPAPTGDIRYA